MTLEEKLIDYAHTHGCEVYEFPLPETDSVSVKVGEGHFIGIDTQKLENMTERSVRLAHELGHCETDSFYCVYSPLKTREKLERRANVWAIEHTVPLDRLRDYIEEGVREEWELAERFEVTVEFMHAAIEYYKNGEIYLNID